MRTKLLLGVLFVMCSQAWADERSALQLSELDSRGQLLCASAMLYFNPEDRAPDPRLLTSVFYHLQTLQTDVLQLGQPPALVEPLQAMQRVFAELDALPPEQRKDYPALMQKLLSHQRELQQAAAAAYAIEQRALPADALSSLISAQSRELASLLLDYQLRHYPLPVKDGLLLPPQRLQALDQSIEARFVKLQAQHAEHAAELGKIRGSYQFVRGQMQQAKSRNSGGAEFYLTRAVTDLDEMAVAVAQNAP